MTRPRALLLSAIALVILAASAWFIVYGPSGPAPVRWDEIGDGR